MRCLTLAVILMLAGVASAADVPQSSRRDNRIQYVNYHPGDVVELHAQPGYVSRVVFAADETVQSVATGFASGWELTSEANVLYVKARSVEIDDEWLTPEPAEWNTNIAVQTSQRLYDFDLRLLPANYDSTAMRAFYRIEFRYPNQTLETLRAEDEREAEREAIAKQKAIAPIPRNWRFSMRHNRAGKRIAPTMAYDDGTFTYLRIPRHRDMPSAFVVLPDGNEGMVNTHIDPESPDVLVVHTVAPDLILRLGRAVVGIENEGFTLDAVPNRRGTTIPGTARIAKAAP